MNTYWTIVLLALRRDDRRRGVRAAHRTHDVLPLRVEREPRLAAAAARRRRDAWISHRPFLVGRRARLLLTERKIAMSIVKNWKTGLSGAALILGALADLATQAAFAKDANSPAAR
jgi:hypothetical protein